MEFNSLLKLMVSKGASDLFITTGIAPSMKVNGRMMPVSKTPLTMTQSRDLVFGIMTSQQKEEFERTKECNFAISASKIGRFRCSAFVQRDAVGVVLRRIETNIPDIDSLNLPKIVHNLAMTKRGLCIFVGATGSGKSTSLASLIGHRNKNSAGHIISVEDPIEFIHNHEQCIVTQREVGIDTDSYDVALKNTLRQAPDVIMIGEIRTRETMEHAIAFAETGHLVLTTLHANSANQAVDRIINFFPEDRRDQLFMDLSLNLRAIVAQQLVRRKDGQGRHVAVEVLLNTPLIADYILKGEIHKIKEAMKRGAEQGMQTFDQALYRLYSEEMISFDEAILHADSANEVRLMIKLGDKSGGIDSGVLSNVELEETEDDWRNF
ncbi:MAG: PilT/PilU family type 4a pilus ATPase [Methylococcales bacterium]|jgi:twitching motility protein PilU|nr:PilT/PilU family type 4a pilus ATPase [Methylococcales bacterium]MBT7444601.1 PilT/PilU family type 4a pilus ATPase [Methylococcales bacterium]